MEDEDEETRELGRMGMKGEEGGRETDRERQRERRREEIKKYLKEKQ